MEVTITITFQTPQNFPPLRRQGPNFCCDISSTQNWVATLSFKHSGTGAADKGQVLRSFSMSASPRGWQPVAHPAYSAAH